MKISLNGKWIHSITLHGDEPEFHYGYGVFETIRTYDGQLFKLADHLKRLRNSAKLIHLQIHPSNQILTRWLKAHCRRTGETRLKLMAAPGRIYILSTALKVPAKLYRLGVAVTTYPTERTQTSVKGNAWVQEYLAYQAAITKGYYDALLVNSHSQVPEAACGNIFFVKDNQVYTTNQQMLYGVTRGVVLKLTKVRFKLPRLQDILNADECFITKTSTGIVPIVRVNRTIIGNGKPGPVTKHLIELFTDYVEK